VRLILSDDWVKDQHGDALPADGAGHHHAAQLVAVLENHASLSISDFILV